MAERLDADGKVIGAVRGAKAFKRWTPKEWRPEYEAIVALSCTGLSNEAVGARFGYGKQHVSNILNTPQARKLRELITNRLRDTNNETLAERIKSVQNKALERVADVIESDNFFEKNPLAIFDRSLAFLKSTGKVAGEGPTHVHNTQINKTTAMIVTPEAAKHLSEGLHKANEVKVLHSGNTQHNGKP